MTKREIEKMATELEQAGEMLNDETGEWWVSLAGLIPRYRDCASDSFSAAIEAEIKEAHQYLNSEFHFAEETYTAHERRLVRNGEE